MFFKINDKLAIGAENYRTSRSWGHKAHLYRVRTPEYNDELIESDKIRYYNRTWEAYEFQSIMYSLIDKALKHKVITQAEYDTCYEFIKNYTEPSRFNRVAMIAKMGELLTENQAQANDWKARMLKAGIGEALDMPADWSTLSEDEKQSRLDKAIQALA